MKAQPFIVDQHRVESLGRELVERMARQDQAALQEFYARYSKLIFSFVLKIVRSQAEAEEVVMDVFWQAWQQAGLYSQSRGSVSSWIITIARSRAIDRKRYLERQNIGDSIEISEVIGQADNAVTDPEADPEVNLYLLERREAVLGAIAQMGDKQRQAIELAYFSGMSQSEIADLLKEPLGTVKTRMRSALQVLREKLERYI
ncbi:MAG: sigma-70 family RNA polymerase sigma factor [Blastocatellia bacterium]|nr:sigma-70 family RNA polymerase sigma factor [Blastocatellia bacterium]